MPTSGDINGIAMADIADINGVDVPSGGGVTANALATTGVQICGVATNDFNSNIGVEFGRGAIDTTNSFTKIVCNDRAQLHALKSDGTLWYNYPSSGTGSTHFKPSAYTADRTWRKYGSDTNWTDISGSNNAFGAIKDGDYWFLGYGAYRQRGDGSSSSASNWTEVNSAGNWTKVFLGYRTAFLINSSAELYSTGYGYDYMSGQGTTSTISTFAREQSSLTNVVEVSFGYRCAWIRLSNGSVHFTGFNGENLAGPQITSTSDQNGPTLAVDHTSDYVCGKLGSFTRYGGCHIDTDTYLRFHGKGQYNYIRPDNQYDSSSNAQGSDAGLRLDSLGTGYTDYHGHNMSGGSDKSCFAIKSGELSFGGSNASELKSVLGLTADSSWEVMRSANATTNCIAANRSSNLGHFVAAG